MYQTAYQEVRQKWVKSPQKTGKRPTKIYTTLSLQQEYKGLNHLETMDQTDNILKKKGNLECLKFIQRPPYMRITTRREERLVCIAIEAIDLSSSSPKLSPFNTSE